MTARAPAARRVAASLLLAAFCLACRGASLADRGPAGVREPAVAGQFYPAAAPALRTAVESFLRDAPPPAAARPAAIVAPHAGYIYSGQVAADAWRQAEGADCDLVVILGTNHTSADFRGVAVHPGSGFRTPLGVAETDRAAARALLGADPDCVENAEVHAREHSVEVQVPFAQVLFPRAKILPLVIGVPDPALCARLGLALGRVLRGRRALVVASSDLSHYPAGRDASEVDGKVLRAVARVDAAAVRAAIGEQMARGVPGLSTCACGEGPILAAIAAADALGARRGIVVGYANSADMPLADPHRAVGYGAVVFAAGSAPPDVRALDRRAEPPAAGALDAADRRALLSLARETIGRYLATGTVPAARGLSPRLRRPQGAFVTLGKAGQLRGCVGRMDASARLDRVVVAMALQAAFNDRRFPPVAPEELPLLSVEISLLTPMRPVSGPGDIRVGIDGVLLEKDGRQAVFLPQVATEQGWGRDEMLDQLCVKAGLSRGSWRRGAGFSVFQSEVIREEQAH